MTELGARFLVEPALFPRRISCEVWGPESVTIELAGERYHVDGLSATQATGLEAHYGSRLVRGGEGVTTIHVFRAPRSDFREIDTRGWEYSLDLDWTEAAVAIAGMQLMARADFNASLSGLWTCVEDSAGFPGVLENVLRPILAARLLANDGLLLHSAAVDGTVFPSVSGGGKSTISRMALRAGLPVLSDDLNALVRDGNGWSVTPLPFTGDLVAAECSTVPQSLRAVIALEKGEQAAVRKMPLADAVALLVRCAPYVNQDAHRTEALIDRAAEVAAAASRAVLTFRIESNVWPILQELR